MNCCFIILVIFSEKALTVLILVHKALSTYNNINIKIMEVNMAKKSIKKPSC